MSEAILTEAQQIVARFAADEMKRRTDAQVRRAGLPARHWSMPTAALNGSTGWQAAYETLRDRLDTGFLSLLLSGRGHGKTQMAVELCRHRLGQCRYTTALGLFLAIQATYHRDAEQTTDQLLKEFSGVKLLVIDEIHERSEKDWENRMLTHLIDRRYAGLMDTLLIGNLNPEEASKSLGPSIISRLNETGGILACNWESFRK